MNDASIILCTAAASIGFMHTLLGPDHYVPFIAMSRAGRWSMRKTLLVTLSCGLAHVLSSIILGTLGIILGVALFKLENIESVRAQFAGWLLIGFGLAYLVWGVRVAIRNRPHTHIHFHADGTVHAHEHVHHAEHVHAHHSPADNHEPGDAANSGSRDAPRLTPWVLFTIFIFGPCEPLIPLLMFPAATSGFFVIFAVAFIFALTTLATMLTVVWIGVRSKSRLKTGNFARFGQAFAGLLMLACGVAVKFGL